MHRRFESLILKQMTKNKPFNKKFHIMKAEKTLKSIEKDIQEIKSRISYMIIPSNAKGGEDVKRLMKNKTNHIHEKLLKFQDKKNEIFFKSSKGAILQHLESITEQKLILHGKISDEENLNKDIKDFKKDINEFIENQKNRKKINRGMRQNN